MTKTVKIPVNLMNEIIDALETLGKTAARNSDFATCIATAGLMDDITEYLKKAAHD